MPISTNDASIRNGVVITPIKVEAHSPHKPGNFRPKSKIVDTTKPTPSKMTAAQTICLFR